MPADEVGDHRVAGREDVAVRAFAEHRVRSGTAQGRVAVAGNGPARPREHLAVVHLLVEPPEAKLALVACQPQHPLNL